MREDDYKVVRQLDDLLPDAATPHKAGISFDLRLYFREDQSGYQWASVAFLDREANHRIIGNMNLVGDDAVSWFFGKIAERGFPLALQAQTGN